MPFKFNFRPLKKYAPWAALIILLALLIYSQFAYKSVLRAGAGTIDDALVPDHSCHSYQVVLSWSDRDKWKTKQFPLEDLCKSKSLQKFSKIIEEVKSSLYTQKPVLMTVSCTNAPGSSTFLRLHEEIVGYRQICRRPELKDCREVVKFLRNRNRDDWRSLDEIRDKICALDLQSIN